jgi:hypothetical protein
MNDILNKQSIKQIRQSFNNKPIKINNYTLTEEDKKDILSWIRKPQTPNSELLYLYSLL